jgi:hypothetical protein
MSCKKNIPVLFAKENYDLVRNGEPIIIFGQNANLRVSQFHKDNMTITLKIRYRKSLKKFIPDSEGKKAPDPGSATLLCTVTLKIPVSQKIITVFAYRVYA